MWFCTDAHIDPGVGGHVYLRWADGYYVAGECTGFEQDKRIALQWQGKDELRPTDVAIVFSADGSGTCITVEHGNFAPGKGLAPYVDSLRQRWAEGLENLASVWALTGIDLRLSRRPMLGIYLEQVREGPEFGLPDGVRGIGVTGTLEGSGAEACGLVRGDIITGLNGVSLTQFSNFEVAMAGKRAGDTVPMTFFRAGEKNDVDLTFCSRPTPPEIPGNPADLSNIIKEQYSRFAVELSEILADITDVEAGFRPAANTWNVLEILAHLVLFERCFHQWISMLAEGEELLAFAARVPARVAGLLERCPSIVGLSEELRQLRIETVHLIRELPKDFSQSPEYVRMGQIMMGEEIHSIAHHEQVRRTIAAARGEGITGT